MPEFGAVVKFTEPDLISGLITGTDTGMCRLPVPLLVEFTRIINQSPDPYVLPHI